MTSILLVAFNLPKQPHETRDIQLMPEDLI